MADKARREPFVRVTPHTHGIESVYLAVTDAHGDGTESVYTVSGPDQNRIPVVALDDKSLESLRKFAETQARTTGKTVSIICFTHRTLHETFPPVATGD